MNTALTTIEFSKLQTQIEAIIPPGTSPIAIFKDVIDKYPKNKETLDKLNNFKDEYSQKGWFGQKWNKGELEEKTTEATFLLTKMSDSQLKLQILTCWMCNELKKQQDIIQDQQTKLSQQSEELSKTQASLSSQQKLLENQANKLERNDKDIKEQQSLLQKDNEELIRKADVLRKLRELGMKHHADIDKHNQSLTGLEQLLIELEQHVKSTVLKTDYEEFKAKIMRDQEEAKEAINGIKIDTDKKINSCIKDAISASRLVKWA